MNIEIHDPALEARLRRQIETTGSESLEDLISRLLEAKEEQDRWLVEDRDAINSKIQRGISQLDRGEGVPEEKLDAYLSGLKAKQE